MRTTLLLLLATAAQACTLTDEAGHFRDVPTIDVRGVDGASDSAPLDVVIDTPTDVPIECPSGLTSCGGSCIDTSSDPAHCGRCDRRCSTGVCAAGACACPMGRTLCGDACVSLATDPNNCGTCGMMCDGGRVCAGGQCMIMCPSGTTACGSACVDTSMDPLNCGGCGNACSPNQICSSGHCICPSGFMMCSGACVNVTNSTDHCGSCSPCPVPAHSASGCVHGGCTASCLPGFGDCDGIASTGCETPLDTTSNCAHCFNACPPAMNAVATCSTTMGCGFRCSTGFADCDGVPSNGCEVNLLTDATHCGTCANNCTATGTGATCSSGVCMSMTCPAGTTNCGGTCVNLATDAGNCGHCGAMCPFLPSGGTQCCSGQCTDTGDSNFNCGMCSHPCPITTTCIRGAPGTMSMCTISGLLCGTRTNCGGGCTDVSSDSNNCGTCGMLCPTGQTCTGGHCV